MKKITSLTIGLLITLWAWGQYHVDTIVFKYKNGVIKRQGIMVDGKKAGIWKYYDRQGRLTQEAQFKNDKLWGTRNVFLSQRQKTDRGLHVRQHPPG